MLTQTQTLRRTQAQRTTSLSATAAFNTRGPVKRGASESVLTAASSRGHKRSHARPLRSPIPGRQGKVPHTQVNGRRSDLERTATFCHTPGLPFLQPTQPVRHNKTSLDGNGAPNKGREKKPKCSPDASQQMQHTAATTSQGGRVRICPYCCSITRATDGRTSSERTQPSRVE